SSRRRHTRLVSDWSSDVCSSDLKRASRRATTTSSYRVSTQNPRGLRCTGSSARNRWYVGYGSATNSGAIGLKEKSSIGRPPRGKIGRASCKEREWSVVVGRGVKK